MSIDDVTFELIVSQYTREAGVRQLERELGKLRGLVQEVGNRPQPLKGQGVWGRACSMLHAWRGVQ